MTQISSLFWTRTATLLLVFYWIGLFTGTHAPRLPVSIPGNSDKLAHYLAFAGLAFLLSWAWATRRPFWPGGFFFAIGVAAAYGIIDELTQRLVPGRSCELADWLADASGALAGAVLYLGVDLVHRRMRGIYAPARGGGGEP